MRISAPTYTQTPNDLFDHWLKKLKEIELKVLLVIMRKTFGWHKTHDEISISQIQKMTGSTATNILTAIKSLISYGIVKKEVSGKTGQQKTIYSLVIHEDSNNYDPCQSSSTTPPNLAVGTPPNLAVTKESLKKKVKDGIVLDDEKTMPFKSKVIEGCKYPLKKEQQNLLESLNEFKFECDQKTLAILIRKYPNQKILDAITHLKFEIDKGTIFKNGKIAFFRHLLSGKASIVTPDVLKNKEVAESIKKTLEWTSLSIHDKFVVCEVTGKEIPFNLAYEDFVMALRNSRELYGQY